MDGPGTAAARHFTKRLAEDWLREQLTEARRGTLPGLIRTGATFADAAAEYLRYVEHDRGVKPSTLRGYRSTSEAHLLPAFGSLPREDVTTVAIEQWVAGFGGSVRTRNKLLIHGQDVRCRPRTLDARLAPPRLESNRPLMSAPSRSALHREPVSAGNEYAALAGFLGQVNGFRFVVLGLFLTAAGFVLSRPTRSTAALIFILSVLLWATELRTRAILLRLVDRGKELEAEGKSDGEAGAHRLFAHIHDSKDQEMNIGPHGREGAPRRHSLPWFVTHTFTIDLIYLVVALYSVLVLVLGPKNL